MIVIKPNVRMLERRSQRGHDAPRTTNTALRSTKEQDINQDTRRMPRTERRAFHIQDARAGTSKGAAHRYLW